MHDISTSELIAAIPIDACRRTTLFPLRLEIKLSRALVLNPSFNRTNSVMIQADSRGDRISVDLASVGHFQSQLFLCLLQREGD
jgi:hypothetical protein